MQLSIRLACRPARLVILCALACVISFSSFGQDDQSDGDLPLKSPGLLAQYTGGESSDQPLFSRNEFAPSFQLPENATLDSRLPTTGWKVAHRGVIDIQQPGAYRFAADSNGRLRVRIADRDVLQTQGPTAPNNLGPAVELAVGTHPLAIEYSADHSPPRLALFWKSSSFPQEPLSPQALGHLPDVQMPDDDYLRGRLAIEEHSCVSCHQPTAALPLAGGLNHRSGPKLAQTAGNLHEQWIFRWLADPQAYRPEAVMPKLFSEDRTGEIERFAVARYLKQTANNTAEQPPSESPAASRAAAGKLLYERTGCVVCHEAQQPADATPIPPRATLAHLADKTTARHFAAYIHDPLATDPAGRMPQLGLSKDDCEAIAEYLLRREPAAVLDPMPVYGSDDLTATFAKLVVDPARRQEFAKLADEQKIPALARQVIETRQCANCHEIETAGEKPLRPTWSQADFAQITKNLTAGCLSEELTAESRAPRFGSSASRKAIRYFLSAAQLHSTASVPIEQARTTLLRFNCQGCHERNGFGGISASLLHSLMENQKVTEGEMFHPPTLSGITSKLRPSALEGVLARGDRSRPWMALKMPQFPPDQVAPLAAWLAADEGVTPATDPVVLAPDVEESAVGRMLVGSQGFGCIKCHDIRGITSGGTRGPDLARVTPRVNLDWYRRWMRDPQRLEPGTRMPTVFFGGQSPYKNVLDGDPERQAMAMWNYLSAGNELELPEGLETPDQKPLLKGTEPLVMRTFLPDVSPRSLAVRLVGPLNYAFDAQVCRLAYAWQGNFLDMSPVWTGRGGRTAGIDGKIFWQAPAGFPWSVDTSTSDAVPNFAARAADPAFGAQPPDDGQLHPSRVHFRGYRLTDLGPEFRYDFALNENQHADFSETPCLQVESSGVRLERRFSLRAPTGTVAWLHVADSDDPPQTLRDQSGEIQSQPLEGPVAGATPLLAKNAERQIVLRLDSADSIDAQWHAVQQEGKWCIALRIPVTAAEAAALRLVIIAAPDDRPVSLLQALHESQERPSHP